MKIPKITRLHRRLFFPLVGLLWLIIGITITYFVIHEKQRQKENLENRLLNVNNTVIDAYSNGADIPKTVDFIKLFTDSTTLDPLRIAVYDSSHRLIALNREAGLSLFDDNGRPIPEVGSLWNRGTQPTVCDMVINGNKYMVSSRGAPDGRIRSFAGLPYKGEVRAFLSTDPMVWAIVIILGLLSSVLAFFSASAICRNVYALRDFARAIASDRLPDDADLRHFSNDELGDVSRDLVTLYRDKIHAEQEKMHHERQIGINVSHELNTPVGIIKGYLDTVLSDDDMPAELKRRFLTRAQQNIDRLAGLVNDLSMVMRLQEDGTTVDCVTVNIHDVAVSLAEDIERGHIADNMEFVFDISEDCRVKAHESLLINALLNLVYNAAKHSGGSRMTLRFTGAVDSRLGFVFEDNGKGVDPEHLGRLFDLFYRVDSGRSRKNGGSGLGLPLVHRIITAMGGDITVENADGGGLRFVFHLPAPDAAG